MAKENVQDIANDISDAIVKHCRKNNYDLDEYSLKHGIIVFRKDGKEYDVSFEPVFTYGLKKVVISDRTIYETEYENGNRPNFGVWFNELETGMLYFEEYVNQMKLYGCLYHI